MSDTTTDPKSPQLLDRVVIRFAGDSGDGMQLAGDRFTTTSALLGNDLATFPDFPAEIRAPAGTLAGVSAFQVHISDHDISTPGDSPNVLVAMNPAALKANLDSLPKGATIIVNVDAFEERNLAKAGYEASPLADGSLSAYTVYEVPMTSITTEVSKDAGVKPRDAERSKNFFALGLISWLYTRPIEATIGLDRPRSTPASRWSWRPTCGPSRPGSTSGRPPSCSSPPTRSSRPRSSPASTSTSPATPPPPGASSPPPPGAACPCSSAPTRSPRPRTSSTSCPSTSSSGCGPSRPRTRSPASAPPSGPPSAGALGVTTTSGPGIDLKSETMGLAISLELPLLIIDIQRGGPSTGLPTKTEQADLLHAMYGRHGEAPLPIVAAKTPSHCFEATMEAVRLAVKYRTPVILLSDGYLANGTEPWRLPDLDDLPAIDPDFATAHQPHRAPTAPRCSGPTSATRRPWPDRGPRRACPASSTASAAWRRPTARATWPTTAPTTSG